MNNSDTNLQQVEAAMDAMRLAMSGAKERLGEGLQLTRTQVGIIKILAVAPQTTGELSRQLFLTGSAVTQTVDTLVRRGLVERRADEHDRRLVHLALTPDGLAVTSRLHDLRQTYLKGFVGRLSTAEIDAFISITAKLTAQLHDTKINEK